MAGTVTGSFNKSVPTSQQSPFVEIAVPIGTDKIEIDLASGGVRLVAIAFGASWDDNGSPFSAINGWVPWAEGGAWQPVTNLTAFNITDSSILKIPYAEVCGFEQMEFVLTSAQTAATKIGFFGWSGG